MKNFKTQISNLINGSENTLRDLASVKYVNNPIGFYTGKNNVPQLGGTPAAIRNAVANKVSAENPETMHINVRGVDLNLARYSSTSGQTWWWAAYITAEQFSLITGYKAPIWTHKKANNNYCIVVNDNCTVEASATSGKKGFTTSIGEEYIEIL